MRRLREILRRRTNAPPTAQHRHPAARPPWRRGEPPVVHAIGERRFAEIREGPLEQELHAWTLVRKAGLDSVVAAPGEGPDEHGRRIFDRFVASGVAIPLLACGLVPEGFSDGDWTPEIAADTERYLARITDPADKAYVQSLLLSIVEGFFLRGIASFWTSATSSDPDQGNPTTASSGSGTK